MKRILIFMGLKIVEIGGIGGLWFLLGLPSYYFYLVKHDYLLPDSKIEAIFFWFFVCPVSTILPIMIIFCFCIGIYTLIQWNWEKAKDLEKKWFKGGIR